MRVGGLSISPALLLATTVLADEPVASRMLRHDPFSRSAIQQRVQKSSAEVARPAETAPPAAVPPVSNQAVEAPVAGLPSPATVAEPLPVLRALLRSGSRPMANVGGKLLEIGDSVDGLRLIEIGEYSAVFMKGHKKFELALGGATTP